MDTRNETVEGFTNYPTFAIGVVIDNDRGFRDFWIERAREAVAEIRSRGGDDEDARGHLAGVMKDNIESEAPELDSFYSSLLSYGISSVDWFQLAEHYIEQGQ